MSGEIEQHLAERRQDLLGQLGEWVRIPSVGGAPEHGVDLFGSANWLGVGVARGAVPAVASAD